VKTAIAKLGNSAVLVGADGSIVLHQDAEEWTFHLMPMLYLPCAAYHKIPPANISLKIECLELWDSLIPVDGIIIRQPYPNPDYFVAGTRSHKMGWSVELPSHLQELHLVLNWEFSDLALEKLLILRVQHRLELAFVPTEMGHVFSMDNPYFARSGVARAITVVAEEDVSHFIAEGLNGTYCFERDYEDFNRVIINQTLIIPSCLWSDLGLEEFEEIKLLRDVKPATSFVNYVENHCRNACCEIPAQVIHQAILLGKQIPFNQKSPYWNNFERHPAMLCLSQWWNQNAPVESYRCAAHAKVWARVKDDDEYWPGYYEELNRSVEQGVAPADCVARWDNFLLIEFAKGHDQMFIDENERLVCPSVAGDIFELIAGISLEKYHPAWYSLVALEQFSDQFPAAWEALCKAVSEETNND